MKSLIRGILGGVMLWWLRRYRKLSVALLRLQAVILYVQCVQTARKVIQSAVFLVLCIILAAAGFIFFHVGLYTILPALTNSLTLMILGAIYMILALLGIASVCSEKRWMKDSHAAKLTEIVTKREEDAENEKV